MHIGSIYEKPGSILQHTHKKQFISALWDEDVALLLDVIFVPGFSIILIPYRFGCISSAPGVESLKQSYIGWRVLSANHTHAHAHIAAHKHAHTLVHEPLAVLQTGLLIADICFSVLPFWSCCYDNRAALKQARLSVWVTDRGVGYVTVNKSVKVIKFRQGHCATVLMKMLPAQRI